MRSLLLTLLLLLLFALLLLWWQKKEKEHFQLSWDSKSPESSSAFRSRQINNNTYKLDSKTFYHILSHWNPNDNSTFYSEDPRSG